MKESEGQQKWGGASQGKCMERRRDGMRIMMRRRGLCRKESDGRRSAGEEGERKVKEGWRM